MRFICPICKKDVKAQKAGQVANCAFCKKLIKAEQIDDPPADTGAIVAIVTGPMPPSISLPDATPLASVQPSLTLPSSPAAHLPVVETIQSKIQRIADQSRLTATYFSWCPIQYASEWIKAAADGTLLTQGRKKQPPPPQGSGLYCVVSPMRSCTWAGDDTVCMVIKMVNVPSIAMHNEGQMTLLAEGPLKIDAQTLYNNANVDAQYLLTYGGSDGGFSRLTANAGVTISTDLIAELGEKGVADARKKLSGYKAPRAWDAQIAALRQKQ